MRLAAFRCRSGRLFDVLGEIGRIHILESLFALRIEERHARHVGGERLSDWKEGLKIFLRGL